MAFVVGLWRPPVVRMNRIPRSSMDQAGAGAPSRLKFTRLPPYPAEHLQPVLTALGNKSNQPDGINLVELLCDCKDDTEKLEEILESRHLYGDLGKDETSGGRGVTIAKWEVMHHGSDFQIHVAAADAEPAMCTLRKEADTQLIALQVVMGQKSVEIAIPEQSNTEEEAAAAFKFALKMKLIEDSNAFKFRVEEHPGSDVTFSVGSLEARESEVVLIITSDGGYHIRINTGINALAADFSEFEPGVIDMVIVKK